MQKSFILFLVSLAIISYTFAGFSEDEDVMDYSSGIVVSVNIAGGEISVSEFDWDAEGDITVTYSVASDAVFEGAASLNDINTGDEVSIDYIKKNNKKIAKLIEVYEAEFE